jgi:hypothetical protein
MNTKSESPLLFDDSSRIILNIGGAKYDTYWRTFSRLPNSRLGKIRKVKTNQELLTLCDEYQPEINEIYFNRSDKSFKVILDFYRTGKLHADSQVCIAAFYDELNFWGIDDSFVEVCCSFQYNVKKEQAFEEVRKINEIDVSVKRSQMVNVNDAGAYKRLKAWTWSVLEEPDSSRLAKVGGEIFKFI